MANHFQKFIFNLSTMSPCAFLLIIMTWIQMDIPPIIDSTTQKFQMLPIHWLLGAMLFLFFILSIYPVFFIKICQKKMETVHVAVAEIVGYDSWGIAIVLSYVAPIASIAIKDYSFWITIIVLFILFSITGISNVVFPSPLLLLKGYHFYKFKNIDGGGEYTFLSHRTSINSGKSVKKAICAFEYMFIEPR